VGTSPRFGVCEGHYQVLGLGDVDPELVAEMVKTFSNVLDGNR
jgi:hypothetical protein